MALNLNLVETQGDFSTRFITHILGTCQASLDDQMVRDNPLHPDHQPEPDREASPRFLNELSKDPWQIQLLKQAVELNFQSPVSGATLLTRETVDYDDTDYDVVNEGLGVEAGLQLTAGDDDDDDDGYYTVMYHDEPDPVPCGLHLDDEEEDD